MSFFFTADWQLNHTKNIEVFQRPFKDCDEMNETIISNTNAMVGTEDRLYFLGDLLFGPKDDDSYIRTVKWLRKKINCKNIFLIYGNHDSRGKKYRSFRQLFTNTSEYLEVKATQKPSDNTISLILSHYPIVEGMWNRYKDGSIHLHGHSQGMISNMKTRRVDVGIDCVHKYFGKKIGEKADYRPLSLDEIVKIANKQLN